MATPDAIRTASLSDIGRVRAENQDACSEFRDGSGARLLVLADGMGGHQGGATASRLAIQMVGEVFGQDPRGGPAMLRRAVEVANEGVYEAAGKSADLLGMGTTCVALLLEPGGAAWVAHVGDSRAYRLRAGRLERLTDDHSTVAELERRGVISAEEATLHPRRHELLRSIGVEPSVEVDVSRVEARAGDRFLLCSDGLSGVVEETEIAEVLGREAPERAVRILVDAANERGGPDNVTVVIGAVDPESGPASGRAPRRVWLALVALLAAALLLLLVRQAAGEVEEGAAGPGTVPPATSVSANPASRRRTRCSTRRSPTPGPAPTRVSCCGSPGSGLATQLQPASTSSRRLRGSRATRRGRRSPQLPVEDLEGGPRSCRQGVGGPADRMPDMPADTRSRRPAGFRRCGTPALALYLALSGCAHWPEAPAPPPPEVAACTQDAPIYQSAHEESIRYLEREVDRLTADLRQAEEAMVAIESGMRGAHSRADAVSELAESRIALKRAQRAAPWRVSQIREARAKLEEAERQFQADHAGSAIFFASRARRIAETLQEEAQRVSRERDTRFIDRPSVNLRAGPSTEERILVVLKADTPVFAEREQDSWVLVRTTEGPAGWVYGSLLRSD